MIDINDLDIMVIANKRREPVISRHLNGIPHIIHFVPDYDYYPGLDVQAQSDKMKKNLLHAHMAWNALYMWRAFCGHRDVLRMCTKEYSLILEDDARPIRPDWLEIARTTDEILNDAELASLHAREADPRNPDYLKYPGVSDKILLYNNEELAFTKPWPMANDIYNRTWALGSCMAYVIQKHSRSRLIDYEYDGLPIDFITASRFDMYYLRVSPFAHGDDKSGTLMA